MNKILVFIDSFDHFKIFQRMKTSLLKKEHHLVYVTNRYSVYKSECQRENIYFIKKRSNRDHQSCDYSRVQEYVTKSLNKHQLNKTYNSTIALLKNEIVNVDGCFLWNGAGIVEHAISHWARGKGIPLLYFENANISNRMQCDPKGVNAQSSIYGNEMILNELDYCHSDFRDWQDNYIQGKLKSHSIGQSKGVKKVNYAYLLDIYGVYFRGGVAFSNQSILKKLVNKILARINIIRFDDVKMSDKKYVFYPMQVKSDTQLKLNSDIDNLQAVKNILKEREESIDIFVKPHPAEPDLLFQWRFVRFCKKNGIKVVNNNTFHLINDAIKVYTINSTVGLEALICKKEVVVFGRAIYKNFTQIELGAYISKYLLEAELFSDHDFTQHQICNVLERLYSQ